MTLNSAFRTYLDELNPLVEKLVAEGFEPTPESARSALAGLNQFAAPAQHVDQVFDKVISNVTVRVYVPKPEEATDIIYFIHGGGHMAGDLDVYDYSARRLAVATEMIVVSVDYARSPEAPYPQGLEETYRVLQSLPKALSEVKNTGQIHAFADSGGGAKLASIAQRVARGEWTSPIKRQVLLYPSLDYTMSGESLNTFGTGYFLSSDRILWYFDNYFPEGTDRAHASPSCGPFNASMPETLVIPAEYDPLLSESIDYVKRAQEAGAPYHILLAEGMIHAFAFFETMVRDDIARLYEVAAEFLKEGTVPSEW